MKKTVLTLLAAAGVLTCFVPGPWDFRAAATEGARAAAPRFSEDALLETKRQQLAEKEAQLKAKEESLKKLAATLESRAAELNAAKKGLEGALGARKKAEEERYKKMVKIYKSLKPSDAGNLLNKLDEKMLIDLLNLMDQKTVVKLIPFITQPRVLEWTRLTLRGA